MLRFYVNSTKVKKGIAKGMLSLAIVAICLAAIPAVARVGLLILSFNGRYFGPWLQSDGN